MTPTTARLSYCRPETSCDSLLLSHIVAEGSSHAASKVQMSKCRVDRRPQEAAEARGELIFAKPDHVGVQAFRPAAIAAKT